MRGAISGKDVKNSSSLDGPKAMGVMPVLIGFFVYIGDGASRESRSPSRDDGGLSA
jgi:hypothetical protein